MKNTLRLVAVVLCFIGSTAIAQNLPRITPAQGRALVLAALTPQERRLPSLGADLNKHSLSLKFLTYTVTWAGTKDGSVVVGNYAVDPFTADVFSATIECHEEKNKNLEALQNRVRAKLHLTGAEYEKVKTKGPLCE